MILSITLGAEDRHQLYSRNAPSWRQPTEKQLINKQDCVKDPWHGCQDISDSKTKLPTRSLHVLIRITDLEGVHDK